MDAITFPLQLVTHACNLYQAVKDADAQFDDTKKRVIELNAAINAMDPADRKSLKSPLDNLTEVTHALREYLKRYQLEKTTNKFQSKFKTLFNPSRLREQIDKFNAKLDALIQTYNLAMGAQLSKNVRGVRELLQPTNGANADDEDEAELLLTLPKEGVRRTAVDLATVPKLIRLLAFEKQADEAALKLCEMAEADVENFQQDSLIMNLVATLVAGSSHNNTTSDTGRRLPSFSLTSSMALRVLYRLARVPEFEIAMVQAGALDIVSKLLREAPMGDARAALCAMLTRLLVQADHKQQLLTDQPSLLEGVVTLVHNGSPTEKLHAISVVGRVAEDHSKGAEKIAQLKTIPVLIDALYVGETPRMRFAALRALWNMSSLPKNNAAVVDEGGVPAIVEQLRHGDSDAMKQLAASTLAWLAEERTHDPLIGEAEAIPPLVRLLVSGTPQQRNSAAWALAELADHAGNATKIMDEPGAARALLAAFRSADDVRRRAKAGHCLEYLAQFASDKAVFVKQLGLGSIVDLLNAGTTDQRQNAARVLRFLVEDVSVRKKAVEMDAIQRLLGLDESQQPLDRPPTQAAVDALCAFIEGEEAVVETCRGQILDAGGVAILTKLLGDCAGFNVTDNQAANKVLDESEPSDKFASVAKALVRIAVSKQTLEQVVALRGVDIALHALDQGSPSMKLRAVAFLAEFTRKCLAIGEALTYEREVVTHVCIKEIETCAAVFTQMLRKASVIRSLDGAASLRSHGEMVVYAAHWLLVREVVDETFSSEKFLTEDQIVELFPCTVLEILVDNFGDPELLPRRVSVVQTLCAEAIYLLAADFNLEEFPDLERVFERAFKALDDLNPVVAKYVVQAVIKWSKEPSNVEVLGRIGANRAVTWAVKRNHYWLVWGTLEMLGRLPPLYGWVDLPAATKDAVVQQCIEECKSKRPNRLRGGQSSKILAAIYDALDTMKPRRWLRPNWKRTAESDEDARGSFLDRVIAADLVDNLINSLACSDSDALRIIRLVRALAEKDPAARQKLVTQCQRLCKRLKKILKKSGDADDRADRAAAASHSLWILKYIEDGKDIERMVAPMLNLLNWSELKLVSDFVKALLHSNQKPWWSGVVYNVLKQLVARAIVAGEKDKGRDFVGGEVLKMLCDDLIVDNHELRVKLCGITIQKGAAEVLRRAAEKRELSVDAKRAIWLLGTLVDLRSDRQGAAECARLVAGRGLAGPLLLLLHVCASGKWKDETTRRWLLVVLHAIFDNAAPQLEPCRQVVTLVSNVKRDIEERVAAAELLALCVRDHADAAVDARMLGAFKSLLKASRVPENFGVVMERVVSVGTATALQEATQLVQMVVEIALCDDDNSAYRCLESITSVFETWGDLGVVDQCASALHPASENDVGDESERIAQVLASLAASPRCCTAMAESGVVSELVDVICGSPSKESVIALGTIAKRDATLRDVISSDAFLRSLLKLKDDYDHEFAMEKLVEDDYDDYVMDTLVVLCTSHEVIPRLGPNLLDMCVKTLHLYQHEHESMNGSLQFLTFLAEDESFGRTMANDDRFMGELLQLLRIDCMGSAAFIRLAGLLARHDAARAWMLDAGVDMILVQVLNDPDCSKEAEQTLSVLQRATTPAAAAF